MTDSPKARPKTRLKSVLEFFALAAPIVCLFDCIVLPALSALLPIAGMHQGIHGISEQAIFFLVLALCAPVIIPGYLKHRSKNVLFLFLSGISLLFLLNFVDLELGYAIHAGLAVLVSFCLIKANLDNRKLLACSCSSHKHEHEHEHESVKDGTKKIDYSLDTNKFEPENSATAGLRRD